MSASRPTAFVVCGPESSGNRLTAGILLAAGCAGSSSAQPGEQDWTPDARREPLAVLVRSLPHGGKWPDLIGLWRELHAAGYDVRTLVQQREHTALVRSQVARGHVQDEQRAAANIEAGYRLFFSSLYGIDGAPPSPRDHFHQPLADWFRWRFVSYEALLLDPALAVAALLDWCGLPMVEELAFDVEGRRRRIHPNTNAVRYRREPTSFGI